jgi:hypothetical protein
MSASVYRIAQFKSCMIECVLELLKLGSILNECEPLPRSIIAGASLKSSGLHTDRSPIWLGPFTSAAYASVFRHPAPS